MNEERQSVNKYMDDGWYSVDELWMMNDGRSASFGTVPHKVIALEGKEGC